MSMSLFARSYRDQLAEYERKWCDTQVEQVVECDLEIIDPTTSFLTPEEIWKDGYATLQANEFYSVSLVGPQGSGKTTIAQILSQFALDAGFKLIYALPDDFISNLKGWLDMVTEDASAKNCLVLDDLSYGLATESAKKQAAIKNAVARFRHIFHGQIFVIYITHRLHAAPPMLRNSGSWIFSSMQSADRDDARDIIGKNKQMRETLDQMYTFIARVSNEGPRDKNIHYELGGKKYSFKWGVKDDPGDGRLLLSYHAGKLQIFISKVAQQLINFEEYRYIPPPLPVKAEK